MIDKHMIKKISINYLDEAKKVLDIQKESYKIEAELIGYFDIPPLKEKLEELQSTKEELYGYYIDEELVGFISYEIEKSVMIICRMVVHPKYFRKGIAGRLLTHIENMTRDIEEIIVCTGSKNMPAIELYKKKGFKRQENIEIEKGLKITKLKKIIT